MERKLWEWLRVIDGAGRGGAHGINPNSIWVFNIFPKSVKNPFRYTYTCPIKGVRPRIKISVFTDISVFINYSKFKYIFNLCIKISLKVYKMNTFHFLSYRLGFS